jgi:hypothetical protein
MSSEEAADTVDGAAVAWVRGDCAKARWETTASAMKMAKVSFIVVLILAARANEGGKIFRVSEEWHEISVVSRGRCWVPHSGVTLGRQTGSWAEAL